MEAERGNQISSKQSLHEQNVPLETNTSFTIYQFLQLFLSTEAGYDICVQTCEPHPVTSELDVTRANQLLVSI